MDEVQRSIIGKIIDNSLDIHNLHLGLFMKANDFFMWLIMLS
jgi:hypothetical protein